MENKIENNKIIEIGSNLFSGFYESIFCSSDDFIDDEIEDRGILKKLLYWSNNDDIEVVYEYDNFDEYQKDVCKEFMEQYVDKIIDILPSYITNNKDFKFDIVADKDNIVVISPKYYNFTTDKCYCNIETNNKTLKLIKDYTLNKKGAEDFILKRYRSYDGYISFLSPCIEDWQKKDIIDYEENMLIGLLDMLILLDNKDGAFELNEEVYYNIDKYCYAISYCYWNGKKYTVYELINKTIRKIKSKYPIALKFDIYPW